MTWRGYVLVSELPPGWTKAKRDRAWGRLRRLGRQQHPQPAYINHSRLSLDGRAMIIEAEFEAAEVERPAIVAALAAELGVNATAVNARATITLMGGAGCTWEQSHAAALAYLAANAAQWEAAE